MIGDHDAWVLRRHKAGKSQFRIMAVVYPEISKCFGKFEKQVFSLVWGITYLQFFDDSFRRHLLVRSTTLIMIFIADFYFTSAQFLIHKSSYFGKEISNIMLKIEADDYVYLVLLRQVTRLVWRVVSFSWEPLRTFWTFFLFEKDFCDTRGPSFYGSWTAQSAPSFQSNSKLYCTAFCAIIYFFFQSWT